MTDAPHGSRYARCAGALTIRAACRGLVDDLHERHELPSVYLLVDGRLRCQGARGYFQVSDGFAPSTGVLGRVVSSGVGEVVQDVTTEPAFVAAVPGLRAEASFPVRVFGEVVGVVSLEARDVLPDAAVDDVRRSAEVLGARLEELGGLPEASLAQRLSTIAVDLASQTSLEQVRRRAVLAALEVSQADSAAIADLTPQGWSVSAATGPLADVLRSWDAAVLDQLSGWVGAGTSSHFPYGEVVPPGHEFLGDPVRDLAVQPLVVAGGHAGLLITADTSPREPDPERSTAMELLASQLAAVLAMVATLEDLAQQAAHDPLTGLANRRGLVDALRAAAAAGSAALVLLDLDGFKAVNDAHGHLAGDVLLVEVARRLSRSSRDADSVFRLGGDEFAVLVRGTTSPIAAAAAGARLVAAVMGGDQDRGLGIGASAGVRMLGAGSPHEVLHDADQALYAAKRAGRGRTVLWRPGLRHAG